MAVGNDLEGSMQRSNESSSPERNSPFQVPTPPVAGKGGVVAFIGPGVEFKGEIHYEGSVQIDGTLEGEIHTNGTLLVGEGAVLNATVNVGSVISKGKITGDIVAKDNVQLLSTAIMDGSLKTPQLAMEIGVVFNGNISMKSDSKMEEHKKDVPFKHQNPMPKPIESLSKKSGTEDRVMSNPSSLKLNGPQPRDQNAKEAVAKGTPSNEQVSPNKVH